MRVEDGATLALGGADGSIDWWYMPLMDGDPLFDRLLDPDLGGRFSLTPVDAFTVERSYRENSNVLEQVFTTATGRAMVANSLDNGISGRLPWSELARRVDGFEGSVEVLVGNRLSQATPWREPSPRGGGLHLDGPITVLRSNGDVERTHQNDCGVIAKLVTAPGRRSSPDTSVSLDRIPQRTPPGLVSLPPAPCQPH
jgi:hypothetical protein